MGVEVGGYDLICLDRGHGGYGGNVGDQWDAVQEDGSLGADACFASGWVDKLTGLVAAFVNETGLSMLETDGPYGGGGCAATNHSHHHDHADSIYRQTQMQSAFFHNLRAQGIFINQPDQYFFAGGGKTGMGYDEQQYSLPRWRDLTISRAGMFDDLYTFLPTMGWMFVPLDDYHAGGPAAAFAHDAEAYEWALAQYLGAGVAACYRGARPFTTPAIEAVVAKWIGWYKAHRYTLVQPIIHLRRPDMQGWDGWIHVSPFGLGASQRDEAHGTMCQQGPAEGVTRGASGSWTAAHGVVCTVKGAVAKEVAVGSLFNPMDTALSGVTIVLPLYYTGLTDTALLSVDGGPPQSVTLARDYSVTITLPVMERRSIHTVVLVRA